MNQEQVITLTSLFSAMQDGIALLEQAKQKQDGELVSKAKKLLLDLSGQVERAL
jgi:hypothetical protein